MKAFRGCTNVECKAYKKVHYKKNDDFCLKCGKPLSFVCADCWKPMEDGNVKYCISCKIEKEQHNEAVKANIKKYGGGAAAAIAGVVVAIPKVVKDSDKLVKDGKAFAEALGDVINMVKK